MSARLFRLIFCFLALFHAFFCYSQQTTNDNIVVAEINVSGNQTTKEKIILRELSFQIGDTILAVNLKTELKNTRSNLINTSLFNFVTIEPVTIDAWHVRINISVDERWYWWPVPLFSVEENNFNTWWLTKAFDRANYGLFLAKENFRGRKERLVFRFQTGYTSHLELRYHAPYVNKQKTLGLLVSTNYSQNHEVVYGIRDNKRAFYRNESAPAWKQILSRVSFEYRPHLYNKHNLQVGYVNIDLADSVIVKNADFLGSERTSAEFFSAAYRFRRDRRNNVIYPIEGYYVDFSVAQLGLGLNESAVNFTQVSLELTNHFRLEDRLHFSASVNGRASLSQPSFYLAPTLGLTSDMVRGYEYFLLKGRHIAFFKSQLRYTLVKNKVIEVKAMPMKKFNKIPLSVYAGLFFDAGYVYEQTWNEKNSLINRGLYGMGVSMDFVSYYDLVFRMEYSVNRLKQHGLFLHFLAPI